MDTDAIYDSLLPYYDSLPPYIGGFTLTLKEFALKVRSIAKHIDTPCKFEVFAAQEAQDIYYQMSQWPGHEPPDIGKGKLLIFATEYDKEVLAGTLEVEAPGNGSPLRVTYVRHEGRYSSMFIGCFIRDIELQGAAVAPWASTQEAGTDYKTAQEWLVTKGRVALALPASERPKSRYKFVYTVMDEYLDHEKEEYRLTGRKYPGEHDVEFYGDRVRVHGRMDAMLSRAGVDFQKM